MQEFWLLCASVIVGAINTLAGSGSLIMLPLLMWAGLPAPLANGTNRVATALQSITGWWEYKRHYSIDYRRGLPIVVPMLSGSLMGAYLATVVSASVIEHTIGVLIVLMLILTLLNPQKWLRQHEGSPARHKYYLGLLLLFFDGIYAGFIQAGAGILFILTMVMQLQLTLKSANAYKLLSMAIYSLPVLLIFSWQGQVDWYYGSICAFGQMIGAIAAARFATQYSKANQWIYALVVVMLLAVLIRYYELYRWVIPNH